MFCQSENTTESDGMLAVSQSPGGKRKPVVISAIILALMEWLPTKNIYFC